MKVKLNWGNITWILFHTFSEKIHENFLLANKKVIWKLITDVLNVLPCNHCLQHAQMYINKYGSSHIKRKEDLTDFFYNFHNSVNLRTRKKIYNKSDLNIYEKGVMSKILDNFSILMTKNYDVRPNVEVLKRRAVVFNLKNWCLNNKHMFKDFK